MKTLVLSISLLFFAASGAAGQSVELRAQHGAVQKIWQFLLRPKTFLADFYCDRFDLEPGESSTCTVKLNQAPRPNQSVTVTIAVPPELTGPSQIVIPAGATSATFQVSRPDSSLVGTLPFLPALYVTVDKRAVADVMIPCCARADRCGLPDAEIFWTPCVP